MKTLEDAWRSVPPGTPVYLAGAAGEPTAALDALQALPEIGRSCRFTGVWLPGVNRRNPIENVPDASADVFFVTPALRAGLAAGRVRHRPLSYLGIHDWLLRNAAEMTAFVQVTKPVGGCVGLGPTVDFTPSLAENGARLIGEINPELAEPRHGNRIAVDRFDALIEAPSRPVTYDAGSLDPALQTITGTIAGMIRSGDTVQLGLGKAQAGVLPRLAHHRDLGFHGGMISDPIAVALEAGVFSRGVTTGIALGTREFTRWISDRDDVRFCPVSHTHNGAALSSIDRLVSVASALEVDLFGQVNAEMATGRQVSGNGGIAEFARGAIASAGGRAIVALPSTAGGGAISRVSVHLAPGTVCSVARTDIDIVVTEYGVAELRGSDIDARAAALISVAHPAFRNHLANGWDELRKAI